MQNLEMGGLRLPISVQSKGIPKGPAFWENTQKQLDELHIALVKPQD